MEQLNAPKGSNFLDVWMKLQPCLNLQIHATRAYVPVTKDRHLEGCFFIRDSEAFHSSKHI